MLITTEDQLRELVAYYLDQPSFAFDVETGGDNRLDALNATVYWLSLATEGRADVIPMGHPHGDLAWEGPAVLASGRKKLDKGKTREDLREADFSRNKIDRIYHPQPPQLSRGAVFSALEPLFLSGAEKIGHNIKFDLHAVAKYYGGWHPPGPYYDTMIASWLLDVTRAGKLGLADCAKRELGRVVEKGVGNNIFEHSFSEVAEYSLVDAQVTWDIKQALDRQYEDGPASLRWLLNLEMEVLNPVLEMEATGVRIDIEALKHIDARLRADMRSIREQIYLDRGAVFSLTSPKDKQEALFRPKRDGGQGLRPYKPLPSAVGKTRSEMTIYEWSTDHESLERLRGNPVVDGLLAYTVKNKLQSTYVLPYLGGMKIDGYGEDGKPVESILHNGRVYGKFKQTGAESGRFSSADPNLQNIPSRTEDGKQLRGIYIASDGNVMICADYSQIEPRIIASLSGDKTMIAAYMAGEDVYEVVGERTNVSRSAGKELVLSIAYGVGPDTISTRIGIPVDEAKDLMNFFTRKFPAIQAHKRKVVSKARANGYAQTITGRRRRLPDLRSEDFALRGTAERQAYNHAIQGTAADIMKIALVNLWDALPEEARMLMTVHDEVVVECPESMANEVAEIVREEMEMAKPSKIVVPLVADVNIGRSWLEGKG